MSEVVQRPHERRRGAATAAPRGLLCVANFPANTGFAWDFIESLFAGLADRLDGRGIRTFVAYPRVQEPPRSLAGSRARAVELDVELNKATSLEATLAFIRRERIEVVYFCDRPVWHPGYAALRKAGVRHIVVHDHTSGDRTEPRGVKRALKRMRMAWPGTVADEVIAVSDFVARRKQQVDLLPADRIKRVWNSIDVPAVPPDARERLRARFGVADGRPVIVCAARATREKGVAVLLKAFDRLLQGTSSHGERPVLIYMGDGPELPVLRELAATLPSRKDILLAGYVTDARDLLAGADVCVVPSVWQEAFGLAALEPSVCGVAVIASHVGGIPEVVVDGETGRLVPPGDDVALADALRELLEDAQERDRLGRNGRARAVRLFARTGQLDQLHDIVWAGFTRGMSV